MNKDQILDDIAVPHLEERQGLKKEFNDYALKSVILGVLSIGTLIASEIADDADRAPWKVGAVMFMGIISACLSFDQFRSAAMTRKELNELSAPPPYEP